MNSYFKVQGFASKPYMQFVQHNLVFNKIPKINILIIALSERYLQRFSQTCELWRSKANWWLRFSLLSVILTDLLGNKTLLHGFKRSWFVICGFRSVLCVSLFQGSLLVIVIMIDGSEKRNCEGGLWTLEFACLWKAQ